MLKLIKYEFRKTMFSKMILLVITALAETAYLAGVFLDWEKGMVAGVAGLMLCAIIGTFYIGIESLMVFHRDLNTKQSYMLFLTPRNSYQILGSKVLENGISIFLTGACFALLAAIDFSVGVLYIGGLKEFLDMLTMAANYISVEITIKPEELLLFFSALLSSWLVMIVIGNLAIVLSATVLAGRKFSGVISFLLFMLISWGAGEIVNHVSGLFGERLEFVSAMAATYGILILMYLLTGWIMERKLSV